MPQLEALCIPATIQRWLLPQELVNSNGPDCRVMVVDADTMIRWDAPDLFEIAGPGLGVVQDPFGAWVERSIRKHQVFFPGVQLNWWRYFNTGMVIVGHEHARLTTEFVDWAAERWRRISDLQASEDIGTDQTLLNFFLQQAGCDPHFLTPQFNYVHCFPMNCALQAIEREARPDLEAFAKEAFSRPNVFSFIDMAYVWHFSNVRKCRSAVMQETWRRVASNYPGAEACPLPAAVYQT